MTMQFPEFQATASVWRGDTAPLRDQKVKKKKKKETKKCPLHVMMVALVGPAGMAI